MAHFCSRPIPLVDAFPISLWIYKQPEEDHCQGQGQGQEGGQGEPSQAKMHILGSVSSLISAQLNHYQVMTNTTFSCEYIDIINS